jgi:hypothetical protein
MGPKGLKEAADPIGDVFVEFQANAIAYNQLDHAKC